MKISTKIISELENLAKTSVVSFLIYQETNLSPKVFSIHKKLICDTLDLLERLLLEKIEKLSTQITSTKKLEDEVIKAFSYEIDFAKKFLAKAIETDKQPQPTIH